VGCSGTANETLEAVWLDIPYPLRLFHHAIIKVAVGLYHATHHNRHGARVKLSEGLRLLKIFRPVFMGVHTDALCRDVSEWLARLEQDGHVDWGSWTPSPFPALTGPSSPSPWAFPLCLWASTCAT